MATAIDNILAAILADPGIKANVTAQGKAEGIAGVTAMNTILMKMIGLTKVNADGVISLADMHAISKASYENPADYVKFVESHGRDNGDFESGFHNFQDNGGTLKFQGRDFINTVADTIFFFAYRIEDGVYWNLDGRSAKVVVEGAGWLNYFLNGKNMVYGNTGDNELHSGEYSDYFAAARNETFMAGDGNDKIWADRGNDRVYGGMGNDRSGGGTGNDDMYGGAGNDTLWGDQGNDRIAGGDKADEMGGGTGNDWIEGDGGADLIYGDDGNDTLYGNSYNDTLMGGNGTDRLSGGTGNDAISGGEGRDQLYGNDGNDLLSGGNSRDVLGGGKGADLYQLWEDVQSQDTIVLNAGASGLLPSTIDRVEGFVSGVDKIDLSGFGAMTFRALDFAGGNQASVIFDGNFLRVDTDGDRAADMIVEFLYIDTLRASDFIFG